MPTTDCMDRHRHADAWTLRAQRATGVPTVCTATVEAHPVEKRSNPIRPTPSLAEIIDQNAAAFNRAMESHQEICATS